MDPVTTYRGELEYQQRSRELLREAEQYTLAQLATEDAPTLWQRINARLPRVQVSVRITVKNPIETLAYPASEPNTRGAATWTR
jgi:hypothetical protein